MNKKLIISGIVLLFILSAVGFLFRDSMQLSYSGTVNLPVYGSLWCGECLSGNARITSRFLGTGTLELTSDCGIKPASADKIEDGYDFLGYYRNGCFYQVNPSGVFGETWYAVCDKDVKEDDVFDVLRNNLGVNIFSRTITSFKGCTINEIEFGGTETVHTLYQQKFLLLSEPETSLDFEAQPFCLFTSVYGQFRELATCDRRALIGNIEDWPSSVPPVLETGKENAIQNVVVGYQGYVDPVDVVKHPVNGNYYFIRFGAGNREIESCPLTKAQDNTVYADIQHCKSDSAFVCIPSVIGTDKCLEGISLQAGEEGDSCGEDKFLGYFTENGQRCEKFCKDGKIEYGNCAKIIDSDPYVMPGDDMGDGDDESYLTWIIVGVIVLCLYGLYKLNKPTTRF